MALSVREEAILTLSDRGMKSREISRRLDLSPNYVAQIIVRFSPDNEFLKRRKAQRVASETLREAVLAAGGHR